MRDNVSRQQQRHTHHDIINIWRVPLVRTNIRRVMLLRTAVQHTNMIVTVAPGNATCDDRDAAKPLLAALHTTSDRTSTSTTNAGRPACGQPLAEIHTTSVSKSLFFSFSKHTRRNMRTTARINRNSISVDCAVTSQMWL
jgi:hypothetical protein